jgi:signal transduction histidine kinase
MASRVPEPGQILSLLSHELRSPLGVVRGYLRLLDQQGGELSDNHRLAVSAALRASERCLELLAQASGLAQLWRNEAPLKRQPVAIGDLLQALSAAPHGPDNTLVPVQIGLCPDTAIDGDRALLQKALGALVMAVHRAQPSAVTVSVSCHAERRGDTDGVTIRAAPITASGDLGQDLPLDLRRGGLGLDLAMAAAIVDGHHGAIHERRGEAGTAMIVWLPVVTN